MTTTTKQRVPSDFPVKPLKRGDKAVDRATCGTCGRSWDDAIPTFYTPAPSARCPFEAFHDYDSDDEAPRRKAEIEAGFEAYLASKPRKHHYTEHEPTGERLGVSCSDCITDTLPTQPPHTPTPWTLSSPMINQLLARETVPDSHFPVTGIDVPEGKGRSHYGGVIVLSEDPDRARLIVRAVNNHDKLVGALQRLTNTGADSLNLRDYQEWVQDVARGVLAELGDCWPAMAATMAFAEPDLTCKPSKWLGR